MNINLYCGILTLQYIERPCVVGYLLVTINSIIIVVVVVVIIWSSQGNSDALVGIGLNLITVATECGSSHLCRFQGLASLVQDSLCKHLIQVRQRTHVRT